MSHHHYEDVIDTSKLIKQKEKEIEQLKEEKATLIEKEEVKNKKALELSKTLEKLKVIRDKTEIAIIETIKELNKYCTHEKTIRKTKYVSGGYLNKSESWTYYYCELCGVKVDEKVEYGSYE